MMRINDIEKLDKTQVLLKLWIDGESVIAGEGENLLSVLFSLGKKTISKNDHGTNMGAYCGMGICFCCNVKVDGIGKQRACQTFVKEGMQVETCDNLYQSEGGINE